MEYLNKLQDFEKKLYSVNKLVKTTNKELETLHEEQIVCIEAREIIQKAVQLTQVNLQNHLSTIVTRALELVFEEEAPKFLVKFVTKRNNSECEIFFSDDGINEMDPLDSCGFGAVDVAAFALRVAIWSLGKTRPSIVFDEPMRHLDSDRMPRASQMMNVLSKELGLQMITITHEESLCECADKTFVVTKDKNGSHIKEAKNVN